MSCFEIRASISALLDGEDPTVAEPVVTDHLAACTKCRLWSADVTNLHRGLRVQAATEEPDRTETILAALPVRRRVHDERVRTLRLVTCAIAIVQLVASLPLLLGSGDEMHGHLARHVGAFSVALAVGLLTVAWRPDRARGTLPILAVLVAGLVWSCLGDLLAGHPLPGSAIAHAADVAGLATVWFLSRLWHEPAGTPRGRRPVLG